jgi:hypothetical protein
MSGDWKPAQLAVRRPLDGGVGHQEARFQLTCTRHNLNPPPFERHAYFASTRLSKTSLRLKDSRPNTFACEQPAQAANDGATGWPLHTARDTPPTARRPPADGRPTPTAIRSNLAVPRTFDSETRSAHHPTWPLSTTSASQQRCPGCSSTTSRRMVPNVRVERRLTAGAARCKVSARTRGWAPALLWRSDL